MRAAQYLRMSTEHQQYSLDNQSAAIGAYAAVHDFQIVETYSDEARSGLKLRDRPGLRQLIEDVNRGRADFDAVLVFDVSRWGRFQDADESAHYEFLCKLAGIKVHYCAEQFLNDGSVAASLLKALKRTMAAEYSRELSEKTFAGQCRIVQNGFKIGGRAGYGLRRLLLDTSGNPKAILRHGEQKSLTTERVIYTLGDEVELRVVRNIYSMFLEGDMSVTTIMRYLNGMNIPREVPGPWNYDSVHRILTHPKYLGCIVFNRSSSRLHTKKVYHPQAKWVLNPGRFPAIVSAERFRQVQRKLANKVSTRSNDQLLSELRSFLKRHGRLSTKLMCPANGLASYVTYQKRFGTTQQIYDRIPYRQPFTFLAANEAKRSLKLRADVHNRFIEELNAAKISFAVSRSIFTLFGYGTFGLEVARCVRTECRKHLRWHIFTRKNSHAHPCLALRLAPDNRSIQDCCLLPTVPDFKIDFSLSDEVIRSVAVIRPSTAEMLRFIVEQGEGWLESWALEAIRRRGACSED